MSQDVEHDGNISLEQLQTNLRFNEGLWRKLTAIRVEGASTISTHDDTTAVPDDSLELVLDPAKNATGSAGSTLICRGSAKINSEEKLVATFRKAAA
jgi:hypothetical protein